MLLFQIATNLKILKIQIQQKSLNLKNAIFHHIFTRVFCFLEQKLESMEVLFHSCLSFLNFLDQIIHFCKFTCQNLIKTYFKPLQTFSLDVTDQHGLE
jgi:hypothetical protein